MPINVRIMYRYLKLAVIGLVSLGAAYLIYTIAVFSYYSHNTVHTNFKQYLWLFKDSVRANVDTFFYWGHQGKSDTLYSYVYQKKYDVFVWEFSELSQLDPKTVNIRLNTDLYDVNFWGGEEFNPKSNCRQMVEFGFSFESSMSVSLDEYSKILRKFGTTTYQGFYGIVNRLALNNAKGEPQIIVDYKSGHQPVVFLFYKHKNSFFVIFIDSFPDKPLDEGIVNIFNLN